MGIHRTYTGPRKWENVTAAPFSEVPDLSRGEMRLAAEVAIAELHGCHVSTCAHERAVQTLRIMATK